MTGSVANWRVLPAFIVRPAGFSFERLKPLRFEKSVAAARELAVASAQRAEAGRAYDLLVSQQRYQDHPAFDDPAIRKALSKHVKRARAFAREESAELPEEALAEAQRAFPAIADAAAALRAAHARKVAAAAAVEAAFGDELGAKRGALREVYRADARLQEAVFLESAEAFERIEQLLENAGPRDQRARQRERLAIRYLQRFCSKNDTNSICGPHSVARVRGEAGTPRVEIASGGEVRRMYFSHWAAEALLEAASSRADAREVVPIRLNPTVRTGGEVLWWCTFDHSDAAQYKRKHSKVGAPEAVAALVRLLAQPRTLAELARLAEDEPALAGEDVGELVEELARVGIAYARPAVPAGMFYPLDAISEAMARWPESEARAWGQEQARAFAGGLVELAAAGMPERVPLYHRMVEQFREATGEGGERGHGRHYADRSIIHEDCHATMQVEIGRETVDPLAAAIAPLVHAASLPLELGRENVRAWFRDRWGERVRVGALDVHRGFDTDGPATNQAETPRARAIRAAIERVHACFAAAIAKANEAGGGAAAEVAAADLWAALGDATGRDRAGYVSVDVMVRERRDAPRELVIGEVHGFFWLPTCLLDIVPEPAKAGVLADMRGAVKELAAGRPTMEALFAHTQATDRRFPLTDQDLWLIDRGHRDGVALGQLEMMLDGDEFHFFDGEREVVPVAIYTTYPFLSHTSPLAPLIDDVAGKFFPEVMLPARAPNGDAPRIRCEGVTFKRRSWRRHAGDLQAVLGTVKEQVKDATLFLRAQELRARLGCPPRVFASFASEPKPMLVDFENFFLLETFAQHVAREAPDAHVSISEMMPDGDELLARGPDGPRTSELRMGFYRVRG